MRRLGAGALMWIAVAATVIPLLWLFLASFKSTGEIFRIPPTVLPSKPSMRNFNALMEYPYWRWMANSIVSSVAATLVAVTLCSLAGYGFAKFRFPFRDTLFAIVIASLAIPFLTYFIPLVQLANDLGLDSGVLVLTLPYLGPPIGVFAMRQFIRQTVPDELLAAARVDGAGELRIFRSIVAPIILPAAGAVSIWCFFAVFTSYMWPLAMVTRSTDLTLPTGLASLVTQQTPDYGMLVAGASLATLPLLILFIALRRHFQSGLTLGAVRG